jgi:hypothetical protein
MARHLGFPMVLYRIQAPFAISDSKRRTCSVSDSVPKRKLSRSVFASNFGEDSEEVKILEADYLSC